MIVIHKALEKVWERIHDLELKAQNQRCDCEKNVGDDLTMADVQSKLLELQLKYTRKILKEHAKTKQYKPESLQHNSVNRTTSLTARGVQAFDNLDMFPIKLQKETQTSERTLVNQPSCEGGNEMGDFAKSETKLASQRSLETRDPTKIPRSNLSIPSSTSCHRSNGRLKTTSPHSHYHMKLSDVPFIVGQSTGASHSLTANVQSIIGMMKTHNANLCKSTPAPEESENCSRAVESSTDVSTIKDMKREVKKLARELSDLTVKQESLREKLENHQDHIETFQEYNTISKLMVSKAREIVEFHKQFNNKNGKTSPLNETHPESPLSSTVPQRENNLTHRKQTPRGKTIEAGELKTISLRRPVRNEPSKQLQASDFVWVHYDK